MVVVRELWEYNVIKEYHSGGKPWGKTMAKAGLSPYSIHRDRARGTFWTVATLSAVNQSREVGSRSWLRTLWLSASPPQKDT